MSESSQSEQFWEIVQVCLIEIYGMEPERAVSEVDRLSSRSQKQSSLGRARDMTYHAQPLHVAGNIAQEDAPMSETVWKRYQVILDRFEENGTLRKEPHSALTRQSTKALSAR